jgi:hypothetical protein
MKITELILKLESIRDQYGNLPVYHYHGGGENEPQIEVSTIRSQMTENYEMVDVPAETRVIIK